MHDALGIIEGTIQVLPLVAIKHVCLDAIQVPVIGGTTQRLNDLKKKNYSSLLRAVDRARTVAFGKHNYPPPPTSCPKMTQ